MGKLLRHNIILKIDVKLSVFFFCFVFDCIRVEEPISNRILVDFNTVSKLQVPSEEVRVGLRSLKF